MASFSKKLEECRKKSGKEACTCWNSTELSGPLDTIKGCSCKYRNFPCKHAILYFEAIHVSIGIFLVNMPSYILNTINQGLLCSCKYKNFPCKHAILYIEYNQSRAAHVSIGILNMPSPILYIE